ncbi:thioredoxin domain-containing protein [Desulforhopalus sp. IMCC35007]|uniref:thioredoxin domain-containing protein n=1 Tax=Desulforhopalus sp. IMCC35007 TaxID=2569543 RepID=UPI001F112475|nr:thioredoxin domain-containing protein [Desulforhopalus sp. IMCC35007]
MYWLIVFTVLAALFPLMAFSASLANKKNLIDTQVQKRIAAGEKPNRLVHEQSPYLLQHAFNPVEWYPWGEEAFAKAREEDKPVFLSIGYSTCHWCHVMAHESFENPEIADILNSWFISIKVDREERPDLDQMYMAATQAMTGSGGWPMSVFLLPDGSPFYAGTYFPPNSVSNRPGFSDVLTSIHTAWTEKRADLHKSANQLVAALQTRSNNQPSAINDNIAAMAVDILEKSFDPGDGGFGQAPKFPRPVIFTFLFAYYKTTGDYTAKHMALHTLRKMAAGGMYDQLGGGFHRYSVDDKWLVPHFEKMLYDQAQLVDSYLDAYQVTREEYFSQTAKETFAYLLRDMQDDAGGFYSAEDADSDDPYKPGRHGEGAFYLWTREDIVEKLGNPAADIFIASYGVKTGGNVDQDPMLEFVGRNILYKSEPDGKITQRFKLSNSQIAASLAQSKEILLKARSARSRPHLDDKIITAWNGMMIGALSRGSRILRDPQLLTAALQAAGFIKNNLYNSTTNTLSRNYRKKQAGAAGQLSDYAFLVDGLLELYQASHDPQWLEWSTALTKRQVELFWNDKDSYFFESVADPSVKIRMKSDYDGAEPTGNSVAVRNLLRLGQLENNPKWITMAKRLVESFSGSINRYPPALPLMLNAWQNINSKPTQVVVAGGYGKADTEALLQAVDTVFDRSRMVLLADGSKNQTYLAKKLPFMETVAPINGKATAYVCYDFTCKLPVTDPKTLQLQLEGKTGC